MLIKSPKMMRSSKPDHLISLQFYNLKYNIYSDDIPHIPKYLA